MEPNAAGYGKAIALRPELAAFRFDLGLAFHNRGDVDAARRSYEIALRLQPDRDLPRMKLTGLQARAKSDRFGEVLRFC